MRTTRVFLPEPLKEGMQLTLPVKISHYLQQVLRLNTGDTFLLFNGQGGEFFAQILAVQRFHIEILVQNFVAKETESKLRIHLGQAISRSERMDFSLQKAVELGVSEITPIISKFVQVHFSKQQGIKKRAHWQGIIISAAEQSGRCAVPKLNEAMTFNEWIDVCQEEVKLICHPCSPTLKPLKTIPQAAALLIGPEGGFSEDEVNRAQASAFQKVNLGPRILRTETATVCALTALQLLWGDIPVCL